MKPLRELKQGGLLSVVLPSYNEEASIPRAAERIRFGSVEEARVFIASLANTSLGSWS